MTALQFSIVGLLILCCTTLIYFGLLQIANALVELHNFFVDAKWDFLSRMDSK